MSRQEGDWSPAHWPVLVPVRERGLAAEHDEPAARPQRAEGAQRQRAAERVEHDVHAFAAGQLAPSLAWPLMTYP